MKQRLPKQIIKKYDIRGLVEKELKPTNVMAIGFLFGKHVLSNGLKTVLISHDLRQTSPGFANLLAKGIVATGLHVFYAESISTPMTYFCVNHLEYDSAVCITGSHNDIKYNGFKFFVKGRILLGDDIMNIFNNDFDQKEMECIKKSTKLPLPNFTKVCIENEYVEFLGTKIGQTKKEQKLKILWFCTTNIAKIIKRFINNHEMNIFINEKIPETKIIANYENENIVTRLISSNGCDIAISLDGDGDRLNIFDKTKKLPTSELVNILFHALEVPKGSKIVVDTKASFATLSFCKKNNCEVFFSESGHSYMKRKMIDLNASFGIEESNHFYWHNFCNYSDDGIFLGLRIGMYLVEKGLNKLPSLAKKEAYPKRALFKPFEISKEGGDVIIAKLRDFGIKNRLQIIEVDGIRLCAEGFWVLFRGSNTERNFSFRGEYEKGCKILIEDIVRFASR